MAFTLEAAIVVPSAMLIAVGIMTGSVGLYERIESDATKEASAMLYPMLCQQLWSCQIIKNPVAGEINDEWTRQIAVNPVKERILLEFCIDTISVATEFVPILKEMGNSADEIKKK